MLWSTLKIQIGRKVNDATATKYEDSILDNANDALRLFATVHTGVASVSTITGDGETTQFPLPENCVDSGESSVVGVYNVTDDIWLTQVRFFPNEQMQTGYYIWPQDKINFAPFPTESYEYQVHYIAHYNPIVNDNSVISVPTWAIEAIKLYAAGRTLEDAASKMALLGQFRTKVDSGNPEHQPILRLAEMYIEQFWEVINQHRAPQYDMIPK
jgi:hypothetical protein